MELLQLKIGNSVHCIIMKGLEDTNYKWYKTYCGGIRYLSQLNFPEGGDYRVGRRKYMPRIERDTLNMQIAKLIAQRGTCNRGSVGCVLTKNGRIISTGYTGSPSGLSHCHDEGCLIGDNGGCIRTVHAEQGAIAFSARNGVALDGATLYVTTSPCVSCSKSIINAGISRVVYEEEYRDKNGLFLLRQAGIEVVRWPQ